MVRRKLEVITGFSLFLEHLLYYEKQEEKGGVSTPPRVQLGGGAYNILKTLESLGVSPHKLYLLASTSIDSAPHRSTVESLLKQENFRSRLLPIQARQASSYYLIPRRGQTWAFGDPGGKFLSLSIDVSAELAKLARSVVSSARVKILTELVNPYKSPYFLPWLDLFLEKTGSQHLVLIPTKELMESAGDALSCWDHLDMVACNEEEARALWKKGPTKKDLLNLPAKMIFLLTRGGEEAWLRVGDRIFTSRPKKIKNPPYIGGAGDATLAAFVFKFFLERKPSQESLDFAMRIGRETLLQPTSYYRPAP